MGGKYIKDNPQPGECFRANERGQEVYQLVGCDAAGRWSLRYRLTGMDKLITTLYLYELSDFWIRVSDIDFEDPNGRT